MLIFFNSGVLADFSCLSGAKEWKEMTWKSRKRLQNVTLLAVVAIDFSFFLFASPPIVTASGNELLMQ